MDKSFAQGPMMSTPGPSSHLKEDMTSACLPQSLSANPPTISVSYSVSSDHDAILGSAGPYDDDGEVEFEKDR
jgi:hypothetical protein